MLARIIVLTSILGVLFGNGAFAKTKEIRPTRPSKKQELAKGKSKLTSNVIRIRHATSSVRSKKSSLAEKKIGTEKKRESIKLAKNSKKGKQKRPRFKVVTQGHVLSVKHDGFQYPKGWLSIKADHHRESICINIITGELCDPNRKLAQLIENSPVLYPENLSENTSNVTMPSQEEGSQPSYQVIAASKEAIVTASPSLEGTGSSTMTDTATSTTLAAEAENEIEGGATDTEGIPSDVSSPLSGDASSPIQTLTSGQGEGEEPSISITGIVTAPYTQDKFIDPELTIHPNAQAAIDHIFRDKRTGHKKAVHPRLIMKLSSICEHFKKQIHLVSGYRNQTHTTSRHYGARASDIQIPGVSIDEIREFAQLNNKRAIGIGLYPKGGFIHLDARDEPSYLWVQQIIPIRRGKHGKHQGKQGHPRKAIAMKTSSQKRRHS